MTPAQDRRRVCLFTGAAGRLGTVFCNWAASQYHIVAVYRNHGLALPTHSSSEREQIPSIFPVHADLTIAADRQRVVNMALERFGKIDLLVNSAVRSIWAPMLATDTVIDSAPAQFQLNVVAPLQLAVLCARAFWRDRKLENLQTNRNIVNVSSIAGTKVYPKLGQSVYASSKAALNQLSRHMADEFGEIGIRVNALSPNSFPRILPTISVCQSLLRLDQGGMSGRVLIVDRDGETLE